MKKANFSVPQSSRIHGNILGVRVTSTSKEQVLRFFRSKLSNFNPPILASEKISVITPNPELLNMATKSLELKGILNSATVAVPDGVGIDFAWRFLGLPGKLKLIKGRVLFLELMSLANKKAWRVFFLGDKAAEETNKVLSRSLKRVKIEAMDGPWLDSDGNPHGKEDETKETQSISKINEFKPHILFVGFNAPKQEKWVYKWLPRLNVGAAMVVGGTFDYVSGKTQLPPKWMEKVGLEWLWRLIRQPWRIGRIINAVVVFPLRVLISRFNHDSVQA